MRGQPGPDPEPPPASLRAWALSALCVVLAPLVFDSGLSVTLLSQMGIAIIACLSYNILLGQGGMLSFGHAVYTGLGAYLAIHALAAINQGIWWLPVSLLPLLGGLAGLVAAAVLGFLATRKSGTVFAMITLGLAELVGALALMFPTVFGGEAGVSANRVSGPALAGLDLASDLQVYYLIAAYTLVCVAAMYAFTATPLGRLLNAVRDNAQRVAFIGYDPQRVRHLAFVVSGFFAGVAGGLAALVFEFVGPEALGAARSGSYLLFTVLGGTTFFFGPVIGAVLMVLSQVLLSELTRAWLLYLGLAFLFTVLLAPGGLAGVLVHLGRTRRGPWRQRLPVLAALALAGALAGSGAAALLEMLYHRQLDAALGPELRFLGLRLDVGDPTIWAGAAFACAAGMVLLIRLRPTVRSWSDPQAQASGIGAPPGGQP
jgi:branched-chain amino acid transport system permease protein